MKGKGLKTQLIRGSIGSATFRTVNRLLALGLGIILARELGAKSYGIYAYAFAIMELLMVLAEVGMPTLVMREIASKHAISDWSYIKGIIIRSKQFVLLTASTVSLVGIILILLLGDQINESKKVTLLLMFGVLPTTALTKNFVGVIRGFQFVLTGQAMNMILRPALAILIIGLGFFWFPELRHPHYAMAGQILAAGIVLFMSALALRFIQPMEVKNVKPVYHTRQWVKLSLPFTLLGGADVLYAHVDIIMLGWLRTTDEVGFFRVAVQGATLVAFGLQSLIAVIVPHFARLFTVNDLIRLQRLVTVSSRVIFLFSFPIGLAFIIFGEEIVTGVFGNKYSDSYVPLAILAGGQMINSVFGPAGSLLVMTGHENYSIRVLWRTTFLNITLNAILIPTLGIVGAAIASAISLIVRNILLFLAVRQRLKINSSPINFG